MGGSNNKIVLITTHLGNYNGHFLKFRPLQLDLDWDVLRLLLKNYLSEITAQEDDGFKSLFRDIKIIDPDTDEVSELDITNDRFLDDDQFDKQVVNKDNVYSIFLKKLKNTIFFEKYLLQNHDGSILIFPTISLNYSDKSVDYVESLIKWIKKKTPEADLHLLLHDKDVFDTNDPIKHHKVEENETSLSQLVCNKPELISLIRDGKVFVFIHREDEDSYCKHIVNNQQLHKQTTSAIIEILRHVPRNCSFSAKIGRHMRYKDMICAISENSSGICYDFSQSFLE